jgi:hypothetical protein
MTAVARISLPSLKVAPGPEKILTQGLRPYAPVGRYPWSSPGSLA